MFAPGTTCFKVMKEKKAAFEAVDGAIELIGVTICGGCPGKRAVVRATAMIKRGADTIVLASCIKQGTPFGFPCPHSQLIIDTVQKKVREKIRIIDYTH